MRLRSGLDVYSLADGALLEVVDAITSLLSSWRRRSPPP
jgi:hypothetical protein